MMIAFSPTDRATAASRSTISPVMLEWYAHQDDQTGSNARSGTGRSGAGSAARIQADAAGRTLSAARRRVSNLTVTSARFVGVSQSIVLKVNSATSVFGPSSVPPRKTTRSRDSDDASARMFMSSASKKA